MDYHVHVYAVKGLVEVNVTAKSQKEAIDKAVKNVMDASVSYHGNYPPSDADYVAIISDSESPPINQPTDASVRCPKC